MYKKIINSKAMMVVLNGLSWVISKITWRQKHGLNADTVSHLINLLEKDYYIILTRHGNHLSTYAINLSHYFFTGTMGYYGHVLMNLENEVRSPNDFRLVEAVPEGGSKFSTFEEVFTDCDSVALLKPKKLSMDEWRAVMDKATTLTGRPYDSAFDMLNDNKLSCVELVRDALEASPEYNVQFDDLEANLTKFGRLEPQMYYECPDFELVFEVRSK